MQFLAKTLVNLHHLFLKCREDITEPQIIEDTLYVNGKESYIPGVLIKTIKAFNYLNDSYDYIFRTNLSSFLILDKFEKFLETINQDNVYAVNGLDKGIKFPSGAGFLISKKILKLLNKENILNDNDIFRLGDDLIIGKYLQKLNINIIPIPRYDIKENDDLNISENIFHIRNKISGKRYLEIEIHKKLIAKYYS